MRSTLPCILTTSYFSTSAQQWLAGACPKGRVVRFRLRRRSRWKTCYLPRRLRLPKKLASSSSMTPMSDMADTVPSPTRTTPSHAWVRRRGRLRRSFRAIRPYLQKDHLAQFDAVCLNNTVGNLFTDPQLRQNLLEFVLSGGGLAGHPWNHRGVYRFSTGSQGDLARIRAHDWRTRCVSSGPGRTCCRQARLSRPSAQSTLRRQGFEHVSEFFRVRGPYSRDRLHVLFSIDTAKTELPPKGTHPGVERADEDYALAWTRNYGRGRVVYCTIGHSPTGFHESQDPGVLLWEPFNSSWVIWMAPRSPATN